jgi:hypothetical protein
MHKIIYHPSFFLFWGSLVSIAFYFGDLLYVAYVLMTLLILISHEHAHAVSCIKNGVKIYSIEFSFWGGMVNCEIEKNISSAVEIITAGVLDTGYYAIGLTVLMFLWNAYGHLFAHGMRFITIPEGDFLWWSSQFAILVFISNIIPGTYVHKTLGNIRTDGWAAWKMRELRDELWNDGKVLAISTEQIPLFSSTSTY